MFIMGTDKVGSAKAYATPREKELEDKLKTTQEGLQTAIRDLESAYKYALSRKRKRNREDEDTCFYLSAQIKDLKKKLKESKK